MQRIKTWLQKLETIFFFKEEHLYNILQHNYDSALGEGDFIL